MSNNCLGRAQVLAGLLEPSFSTLICGPSSTKTVWPPLAADDTSEYQVLSDWRETPDADIYYAVKPKAESLGRGIRLASARGTPLYVDVDDWELGIFLDDLSWMARNLFKGSSSNGVVSTLRLESAVRRLKGRVSVSSRWLQDRFGGVILPHGRDERIFNPARYDRSAIRRELGWSDFKIVLFLGSVRRHKGLNQIVSAVQEVGDKNVRVAITSGGEPLDHPLMLHLPTVPFSRVPELVLGADVVLLPQQSGRVARAQMPAKLYDAMAMSRPIIASAVSDIPHTLGEGGDAAGWLVESGDRRELVGTLDRVLGDQVEANRRGSLARQTFLREYSFEALRPRIVDHVAGIR